MPRLFASVLLLALAGCAAPTALQTEGSMPPLDDADVITATILQINDVYEITPVEGGRSGGLARVATLRNQLLQDDDDVITVMAGDFYSPSALGTARVDGERLAGRQMVAVLNALGLDIATFGNHEFDVSREAFYQRLDESEFVYLAGNVSDEDGDLFPKSRRRHLVSVEDPAGTMQLGFVGVTLASNPQDYVSYTDPLDALRLEVASLEPTADAIVALTHLALEDDIAVAQTLESVDLVLGGHEHENVAVRRGRDLTGVYKADANARSAWVHRLRYDVSTGELDIDSEFVLITDAIPDDPQVAAEVNRWVEIAFAGFEAQGFAPRETVATTTEPLDGRESTIRNTSSALSDLIAQAVLEEGQGAQVGIFNGGSIRIDDVLTPGPVSQYDVIRVLPFGGQIITVEMSGELLRRVLNQGLENRGTGGYLQTAGAERTGDTWAVGGSPIDPGATYTVAISDFLLTGNETGLDYLTRDHPDVNVVAEGRDIRQVVIEQMRARYGS